MTLVPTCPDKLYYVLFYGRTCLVAASLNNYLVGFSGHSNGRAEQQSCYTARHFFVDMASQCLRFACACMRHYRTWDLHVLKEARHMINNNPAGAYMHAAIRPSSL